MVLSIWRVPLTEHRSENGVLFSSSAPHFISGVKPAILPKKDLFSVKEASLSALSPAKSLSCTWCEDSLLLGCKCGITLSWTITLLQHSHNFPWLSGTHFLVFYDQQSVQFTLWHLFPWKHHTEIKGEEELHRDMHTMLEAFWTCVLLSWDFKHFGHMVSDEDGCIRGVASSTSIWGIKRINRSFVPKCAWWETVWGWRKHTEDV